MERTTQAKVILGSILAVLSLAVLGAPSKAIWKPLESAELNGRSLQTPSKSRITHPIEAAKLEAGGQCQAPSRLPVLNTVGDARLDDRALNAVGILTDPDEIRLRQKAVDRGSRRLKK